MRSLIPDGPNVKVYVPLLSYYPLYLIARGIVNLLVPLYFNAVGIPLIWIGGSLAVYGLVMMVFEVLWGFIVDRIGTNRTIPIGILLSVLTYSLFPLVKTVEAAIFLEFMMGFSLPAISVAARSLIIHGGKQRQWGTGFGLLGSAYSVSFIVGSLLGSFVATAASLVTAFYLAAGITLLALAVYLSQRKKLTYTTPREQGEEPGEAGLGWGNLKLLAGVAVAIYIGRTFYTSIMQLVITKTPSISASYIDSGIMVAMFYVAYGFFSPFMGYVGPSRSTKWIAAAVLANSAVFLALTQVGTLLDIDLLAFAEGVCFAVASPLSLSLLMRDVPKRFSGRMMGIYGGSEDVGNIIGPVMGSALWVDLGLNWAYLAMSTSLLLALAFYLVMLHKREG